MEVRSSQLKLDIINEITDRENKSIRRKIQLSPNVSFHSLNPQSVKQTPLTHRHKTSGANNGQPLPIIKRSYDNLHQNSLFQPKREDKDFVK